MYVCMYTLLTFPDIRFFFGPSKLMIFELQLCPIVIMTLMTLGDSSTHATHIILGKSLSQRPQTILIIFSLLKCLYLNTLLSFHLYHAD